MIFTPQKFCLSQGVRFRVGQLLASAEEVVGARPIPELSRF